MAIACVFEAIIRQLLTERDAARSAAESQRQQVDECGETSGQLALRVYESDAEIARLRALIETPWKIPPDAVLDGHESEGER